MSNREKSRPTSFRLRESTIRKLSEIQEKLKLRSRIDALEAAVETAHAFHVGTGKKATSAGNSVIIKITGVAGVNVEDPKSEG